MSKHINLESDAFKSTKKKQAKFFLSGACYFVGNHRDKFLLFSGVSVVDYQEGDNDVQEAVLNSVREMQLDICKKQWPDKDFYVHVDTMNPV